MENRMLQIENRVEKIESEVKELNTNTAISKQEIKMIFNILNEIKDSIKDVVKELGDLKLKPADNWNSVTKTIITVIATAVVTSIIAKGVM